MEELRNAQEDVDGLVLSLPPAAPTYGLGGASAPATGKAPRPPLLRQLSNLDERKEGGDDATTFERATEVIRFEELFEWYLAESENALSDARLLLSRLDGERKRLTLVLANNRNTCVWLRGVRIIGGRGAACAA